jgi:hypothetical protein
MHRGIRSALAACATTLVLGIVVASAYANKIEFSSLTFRVTIPAETPMPGEVYCPFTLEGTFHSRALSKVSGSLIGYVTRAPLDERNCRGGRSRFLTETLPWHIRYESFSGILPAIETIRGQIIGLAALAAPENLFGESCLYVTSATSPGDFILTREGGGTVTQFRWDESLRIPKHSGGPLCSSTAFFRGTSNSVTVLGAATRITVRLI